jgi:hypothetical protein
MTTIKVFEYKYEVFCEDDPSAQYYCTNYPDAYELFCELVGGGYNPFLKLNDKFNEQAYSRATRETLRKIINRTV